MHYTISPLLLIKIIALQLFLLPVISAKTLTESNHVPFKSSIRPVPATLALQMQKQILHQGCPVALTDFAYVKLQYWGFDHKSHLGVLIVNKALAKEVVDIFKTLYLHRFPIQQMRPMGAFNDDDEAAMAANNTSSFNCREVTGQPGVYSQHSYGRAIDINPLINPYVKETLVLPANGSQFVDRDISYPGKITKDSLIYREFVKHGWDWGGSWYDVQDYQHFEKRANGERRNPYGYSSPIAPKR